MIKWVLSEDKWEVFCFKGVKINTALLVPGNKRSLFEITSQFELIEPIRRTIKTAVNICDNCIDNDLRTDVIRNAFDKN